MVTYPSSPYNNARFVNEISKRKRDKQKPLTDLPNWEQCFSGLSQVVHPKCRMSWSNTLLIYHRLNLTNHFPRDPPFRHGYNKQWPDSRRTSESIEARSKIFMISAKTGRPNQKYGGGKRPVSQPSDVNWQTWTNNTKTTGLVILDSHWIYVLHEEHFVLTFHGLGKEQFGFIYVRKSKFSLALK